MINDQKYFTPAIEDLRVGYEFEKIHSFQKKTWTKDAISEFYFFPKGDGTVGILDMVFSIKEGTIRVPYLTKEQIEAEGWMLLERSAFIHFNVGLEFQFSEGTAYRLEFPSTKNELYKGREIRIYKKTLAGRGDTLFVGQCPDINTLRHIQKLLNIK